MPGPRTHIAADPTENFKISMKGSLREKSKDRAEKLGMPWSTYIAMLIKRDLGEKDAG